MKYADIPKKIIQRTVPPGNDITWNQYNNIILKQ